MLSKMINKTRQFFKRAKDREQSESREVARLIGEYYVAKNKELGLKESHMKAREELSSLGVTEIKASGNRVEITLQRPGLLIGRRGDNIDMLQKFLATKSKYTQVGIKEDKIICWLIPYDYSDYGCDGIDEMCKD